MELLHRDLLVSITKWLKDKEVILYFLSTRSLSINFKKITFYKKAQYSKIYDFEYLDYFIIIFVANINNIKNFPPQVEVIKFSNNFLGTINPNIFPKTLKNISFGDFNKKYKKICSGNGYNSLNKMSLPDHIEEITFGMRFLFMDIPN